MLAYAVSKTEIEIPDMELICPSTIHMKMQLQLFEHPGRTVSHVDGDTSALSASGHNLLYAAVNMKIAYTNEAFLCQFNKAE